MNLLMVIFGLVAILAVFGTFQAIKEKNLLSVVFNLLSAAVFGWFVIMTIVHSGYPPRTSLFINTCDMSSIAIFSPFKDTPFCLITLKNSLLL